MIVYIRKRSKPWWCKARWWMVVLTGLSLLVLAVCSFFISDTNSDEFPEQPSVPADIYKKLDHDCDSIRFENHQLKNEVDELRDSLQQLLDGVSVVLDLNNLPNVPKGFLSCAYNLERLLKSGYSVPAEMMLAAGNVWFTLGQYEKALQFYWCSADSNTAAKAISYYNCGIVYAAYGDLERSEYYFEFASLLGGGALSIPLETVSQ